MPEVRVRRTMTPDQLLPLAFEAGLSAWPIEDRIKHPGVQRASAFPNRY